MSMPTLPSRFENPAPIEIAQRPALHTNQKSLLSLSVPIVLPASDPAPEVIRLRDCSLPLPEPKAHIKESLWNYRCPDVITGVSRLSTIMASYMAHELLNPDVSVSFVTIFYRACTEQDQAYLENHPDESIVVYLRRGWTTNGKDVSKQDSFYTDWVTLDVARNYTKFFENLLVEQAGVDQEEFDRFEMTRSHLFDTVFENYPFAVHTFFEKFPQLHVLRHQTWPSLLDTSIHGGVSVRLHPDRIAYAEITGSLKGRTQLVF